MAKLTQMKPVTRIISHRGCPDGIASAMILAYCYPDASVYFLNYGDREHQELDATPGMLFCDMTPPRERVQEFVDAGALCLDHHKHAQDIVSLFGSRGVFDERKCGAELALDFADSQWLVERRVDLLPLSFNQKPPKVDWEKLQEFAQLAGVRDLWKREDTRWTKACAQAKALSFWGAGLACSPQLPYLTSSQLCPGERLLEQAEERVREVIEKRQFSIYCVGDYRVAYFPAGGDKVSDICNAILDSGEADIALAYFDVHDGTSINTVRSLRCRDGIDVGILAKACGGGGHQKAAGFTMPAGCAEDIIGVALIDAINTSCGG